VPFLEESQPWLQDILTCYHGRSIFNLDVFFKSGEPSDTDSSSALAPLHGQSYVSPSLVALAARKIYPHRIKITTPERERSMQWGSSLEAVKTVLEGVTVQDVIEEVLESVETPL